MFRKATASPLGTCAAAAMARPTTQLLHGSSLATAVAVVGMTTTASAALRASARGFFTASAPLLDQQQKQQPPSSASTSAGTNAATAGGGGGGESAMDVALRVNRMKKAHQSNSGGAAGKKQVEVEAWEALNSLTEQQVNTAEGKAVALLLNSWAYFAKYWERGRDGPAAAATTTPTIGAAGGVGGGGAPVG